MPIVTSAAAGASASQAAPAAASRDPINVFMSFVPPECRTSIVPSDRRSSCSGREGELLGKLEHTVLDRHEDACALIHTIMVHRGHVVDGVRAGQLLGVFQRIAQRLPE